MNKIFIRERINVVDYQNVNKGLLYTSSDIDIEGGIINVDLESDVAGWHELTFDIPAFLVSEGELIDNPLLKYLFPLTKLQYTRVIKNGDEEEELILYFIVQPQESSRDEDGIVIHSFTCIDYPRHYLSKAKNGLTIGDDSLDNELSMTPNNEILDVPGRVIYVKAPVQSKEFNSYSEIGLWTDAKPGAFAFDKSTNTGYRLTAVESNTELVAGTWTNWYKLKGNETYTMDLGIPVPEPVWCPDWGDYPSAPDVNNYDYGTLGINDIDPTLVQFYWDTVWFNPDRTIGRYDGILYQEGSRLLYDVFETLNYDFPLDFLGTYYKSENLDAIDNAYKIGTTAYVIETGTIWNYNGTAWENTFESKQVAFKTETIKAGEWAHLGPINPYLSPNYAKAYLEYILRGTGWSVGEVDKIMVDNGTIAYDESGQITPEKVELSTYLSFDESNAYSAIANLCEAFTCYARYDHVNKKINLKAVPGEDNGLIYQYRDNLGTTNITQDGEKAVSKLWVYGGEDLNGQVYIQDCNRMHPDYYLASYSSLNDLTSRVTNPKVNNYAKVVTTYTWGELSSQTKSTSVPGPIVNTFKVNEMKVNNWGTGQITEISDIKDLPNPGSLGQMFFIKNQNSYWAWFPEGNNWYDTKQDTVPASDDVEITFEQRYDYISGTWIDKGAFYHWYEPISPFADNYILDFRYFLDRELITEEQIDDIKFNYVLPISQLNKKRWPLYTEYSNLNQQLLDWNATYDECKIARDAIDATLRTSYSIYHMVDGEFVLKDLDIHAYPPGANIGTTGWTKANITYSSSDAIEVETYADISTAFPAPKPGDYVKVKDEVIVYYWTSNYSYEDTICAYLGWSEATIENTAEWADKRKKELLFSPDGSIEARVRNEGLFQKLRDEELFGDETRASIAPWYNPPSNANLMPAGGPEDATSTSTMHPYYDGQSRYLSEHLNMELALDFITAVETQLTLLLEKIEILENHITSLEYALREKYGDFLVEGVFNDDTMVWIYNLWYAGLEALELYHRPLVTYELGVVDVSGLPEYRTVTEDVYHDIVYRLNQPELVLPNPGDYCYVTDNKLGLVKEKANITTVKRSLSSPKDNEITISTVDTNTEDLIGSLVTAANTIYSKEHIYNRSAVIQADGTIAQDTISSTLDDNSGNLTIMSNNGTVMLGDNGITTIDRDDSLARMQYTGKGIFASTNGGTTWENIVNAGKISIKSLSAGTIDSNNISITNIGHDSSVIIDEKGITALNYSSTTSSPTITSMNIDPLRTSFFLDAKNGNAYFKGLIQSGAGLIGGWTIEPGKLSSRANGTYTAMSSEGTYAFWAGNEDAANANFSVTHAGHLTANNATIRGHVEASTGKVGNFVITDRKLYSGSGYQQAGMGVYGAEMAFWAGRDTSSQAPFRVDHNGNLYASSATITGLIDGGRFSGNIQSGATISGGTLTGGNINVGSTYGGTLLYRNSIGFLNAGYISNHPWASGLNVSAINGIHFYTGTEYNNVGAHKGSIDMTNDFVQVNSGFKVNGNLTVSGGINHPTNGYMNICDTLVGRSEGISIIQSTNTGYARIRFGNAIYLVGGNNGANTVYAQGSGLSNGRILTDEGSASSLNTKKDLVLFDENKYQMSLNLLENMNIYDYEYKYNLYQNKQQYGFIIDELEKLDESKLFFDFREEKAVIENDKINFYEDEEENPFKGEKIVVKKYNPDTLDKYLLTVCKGLLNKINELEKKIK